MKYYYLINNKIMKASSEMPIRTNEEENYRYLIQNWKKSLQPCEIKDLEFDKVKKHYKEWTEFGVMSDDEMNERLKNPIEVTDIVDSTYDKEHNIDIAFFKSPIKSFKAAFDLVEGVRDNSKVEAVEIQEFLEWAFNSNWFYYIELKQWKQSVRYKTTAELYEIFKKIKL